MKRAEKYPLSVAPMMDYTDRHFRYFMRLLTRKTLLYTEMIPVQAVVLGKKYSLLEFSEEEKPLVLQLGGNDPTMMARVAKMAQNMGYDEININVGCPSQIVQSGRFGVILMREPQTVARIVSEIKEKVDLPVGVKFRLGIDQFDREFLLHFVEAIRDAGCDRFTVHARIAVLKGFDPKKNRTIPPLIYSEVHHLKKLYSNEIIEINGGIRTLRQAAEQLNYTDGVMIGRAAYETPAIFAEADELIEAFQNFDSKKSKFSFTPSKEPLPTDRFTEIVEKMARYIEKMERTHSPQLLLKPLMNLYKGKPRAKMWRQHLSTPQNLKNSSPSQLLREALSLILPYLRDDNTPPQ